MRPKNARKLLIMATSAAILLSITTFLVVDRLIVREAVTLEEKVAKLNELNDQWSRLRRQFELTAFQIYFVPSSGDCVEAWLNPNRASLDFSGWESQGIIDEKIYELNLRGGLFPRSDVYEWLNMLRNITTVEYVLANSYQHAMGQLYLNPSSASAEEAVSRAIAEFEERIQIIGDALRSLRHMLTRMESSYPPPNYC